MHRSPLHRNIPPLHQCRLPLLQHHLNLPLQHNPVIQTLRPVHQAGIPRRKVYHSADGAVRVDQAQGFVLEEVLVGFEVGVVVEVCGELGGRVYQAEGHGTCVKGAPLSWGGGVDDCFARGVVRGDVPGDRGEGGDLVGAGHSAGLFGGGWRSGRV